MCLIVNLKDCQFASFLKKIPNQYKNKTMYQYSMRYKLKQYFIEMCYFMLAKLFREYCINLFISKNNFILYR
jgi:hypothetical protein